MSDSNHPMTRDELLKAIDEGWQELQAYIASLSKIQLTDPTDAAGWTVKDHLIHLAMWENGVLAMLHKQSRPDAMGVTAEVWSGDNDEINAAIQQQNQAMPLDAVLETLRNTHQRMMQTLEGMTADDLVLPHRHYQADSTNEKPIVGWIIGNTFEHYREHIPWMQAIVAGEISTGE